MAAAPEWIPDSVWAKLDTSLQREILAVRRRPAVDLPVLVIVGSGVSQRRAVPAEWGDRVAAVEATRAAFDQEARPILDTLATVGARDIHPLWISHAIAATLAPSALIAVAGIPQVRQLVHDAPRKVVL